MLKYGILASLCDPILDRAPIYRATHQVAALHEAIEGYADIQFANIARGHRHPLAASKAPGRLASEPSTLP